MLKKLSIVISIIGGILLALMIWDDKKTEKEIQQVYEAMSRETLPISSEVDDLQSEIEDLEKKASDVQIGKATTQFFVADITDKTYQQIISPMAAYDYPVALGLSLEQMPGNENCMTKEAATSLVKQGWYFCYAYNSKEAAALSETTDASDEEILSAWLDQVMAEAEKAEVKVEDAIYFPSGSFKETFSDVLKDKGMQIVIHHGEIGYDLLSATQMDGLWYAGSAWWRGNEILNKKLSSISASGGEFMTVMGTGGSSNTSLQDWMKQFDRILDQNTIEVTTFSEMVAIQQENSHAGAEEATALNQQISELTQQVETLKEQIREIESRYMDEAEKLR